MQVKLAACGLEKPTQVCLCVKQLVQLPLHMVGVRCGNVCMLKLANTSM